MERNSPICSNCSKLLNNKNDGNSNTGVEKCRQWLNSCNLSDDCSSSEQLSCDYSTDLNSPSERDENNTVVASKNVCMGDKIVLENDETHAWTNLVNKEPNNYQNIQIYKAENVHIGNVTHIHGSVYINDFSPTINQTIVNNNNNTREWPIVSRRIWLAQPPLDPSDIKYFTEPRKFVIICHSASDGSDKQAGNNLLVRLIQQFHIESRAFNDIAYNFLAGEDGNIYEGRGWNIIGSHTLGYNTNSIGICFIGCYMRKLPPAAVLKKVQKFIKYGVEIGAIAEDYVLLGHCQCRSTESPGSKLFEEIKSWDKWGEDVSVENPSKWIIE